MDANETPDEDRRARDERLRAAGIPPIAEMRDLIHRGQDGDESALPELRKLLTYGTMADAFGDLAGRAEKQLLQSYHGDDLLAREATLSKMKQMRAALAGETPTPLERLLVERIVACWLQCSHADCIAALNVANAGDGVRKRQDSAHKRYLGAVKTLAQVRKLALPTLQINLGNQQLINPPAGPAGRRSPPGPPAPALPETAAPRAAGAGPA